MIIDLGGEGFTATGLMVTQRNFLDVYRYQSWGGQDQLPVFTQGQQFVPAAVDLRQVGWRQPGRQLALDQRVLWLSAPRIPCHVHTYWAYLA